MSVCVNCHEEAGEGKFCENCGKPLAVARTCPECGCAARPNARFCPKCGASLEAGASPGNFRAGDIGFIKGNIDASRHVSNTTFGGASTGNIIIGIPQPAASTGPQTICPICGEYPELRESFRCPKCARDFICKKHRDPDFECCRDCAAPLVEQKRREEEARAERERAEEQARAEKVRAEQERKDREARRLREEAEADDEAFAAAKAKGGISAIREYARMFPNGRHAAELQPPRDAKPGEVWVSPSDGRGMVWIPPGSFQMGSPVLEANRDSYEIQHTVRIDRGLWMDTMEVTNEAFKRFVLANPQWQKGRIDRKYHDGDYLKDWNGNEYPSGKANHPVIWVSWYTAKAYAEWAGKRLSTEAEWEYACRAGTTTVYWWGDSFDGSRANNNRQGTVAVGDERHKNPWGLYDMLGNVWEWTSSLYKGYPYRSDDGREDPNASGDRALRGGSWLASPRDLRSAARHTTNPEDCGTRIGFRCVQ